MLRWAYTAGAGEISVDADTGKQTETGPSD